MTSTDTNLLPTSSLATHLPMLLVLPGNATSSVCYQRKLEHFSQRFYAVSPNFLGTVVSDWILTWPDDWREKRTATTILCHLSKQGGEWFHGRLKELQCPVLFTASLRDESPPEVPTQAASIALQIPHCSIFLDNQGSHPLMWSKASLFRNFLAGLYKMGDHQ